MILSLEKNWTSIMRLICNIYLSRIICDLEVGLVVLACDLEACSSQDFWFDSLQ